MALRLVIACLLLSGCGRSFESPSPPASRNATTTLALNWYPDAQHGGFYAADEWGLFQAMGLDVTIQPGQPGTPVVQNVALRKVDFGIANADQVLMARAQDADVVAVFAALQSSPRCVMVHREAEIESLRDLRDLTLAVGTGKAFVEFMKAELPLENVRIVPYTGSIAPFLADTRFAQQAYVFSEPLVVRRQGGDPVTLLVSELGFNPYTSCLITHGDLIREDPDRVAGMVRAVAEGWSRYFTSPAPIHSRIQRENPQMDLESLDFGLSALRPLCLPTSQGVGIGAMDEGRWEQLATQLVRIGFVAPDIDYRRAFTTQFLPEKHALSDKQSLSAK